MTTRIRFEASLLGPATSARVAVGERLMDACDAADAPVPFSCRDANCGTCLVEVAAGAQSLDAPAARERVVLSALGRLEAGAAAAGYRLACRAIIVAEGEVVLRLGKPAPDS